MHIIIVNTLDLITYLIVSVYLLRDRIYLDIYIYIYIYIYLSIYIYIYIYIYQYINISIYNT